MAKKTLHVYQITEIHDEQGLFAKEDGECQEGFFVGGFMVAGEHVRKYHEPERSWSYLPTSGKVGEVQASTVVGKHLGEWAKLRPLVMEVENLRKEKEEGFESAQG